MRKYVYFLNKCFQVFSLFIAVSAFADDWDQCVRDKKLQYIDDHAEDWREAGARAAAYCDIKSPKSAERLSREKVERELIQKMWLTKQEEEQKKKALAAEKRRIEFERKQQEAENERALKFKVGEPFFVTEGKLRFDSGLGIRQSIAIYRDNEDFSRAEYHCKATALIKRKDMQGNKIQESYSQIIATGNVVFGIGRKESTTNINWALFPNGIISITDFNYTCTAQKARQSIFDLPLQ